MIKQITWKTPQFVSEKNQSWTLETLRIWAKRTPEELHLAYKNNLSDEEINQEESDELEWSRWAIEQDYENIAFLPVFPDRSVVIAPEAPFRVTVKGKAKIYVRIPIWVRVDIFGKENISIQEIPTVSLSDTWFGSFTEGELCYWVSTRARRKIDPDSLRPYLAICPIEIINKSEEELFVEKLCLRVAGLFLFQQNDQLWSDKTKVSYRGSNNISQIEVTGRAPSEAKNARMVASPRDVHKRGVDAKTFLAKLKDIPGWGILTG